LLSDVTVQGTQRLISADDKLSKVVSALESMAKPQKTKKDKV
jgi:hypothetical protein